MKAVRNTAPVALASGYASGSHAPFGRLIGLQFAEFLELCLGRRLIAGRVQGPGQQVMEAGIAGRKLHRRLQGANCFRRFVLCQQPLAQVVGGLGALRLQSAATLEVSRGFRRAAQLEQRVPQLIERFTILRMRCHFLAELSHRQLIFPQALVSEAQVIVAAGDAWIHPQRLLELLDGGHGAAGIQISAP